MWGSCSSTPIDKTSGRPRASHFNSLLVPPGLRQGSSSSSLPPAPPAMAGPRLPPAYASFPPHPLSLDDAPPPPRAHRRSHSEIPAAFAQCAAPDLAPPLTLWPATGFWAGSSSDRKAFDLGLPVKREFEWGAGEGMGERKADCGDEGDALFHAYMNFSGLDAGGFGAKLKAADAAADGDSSGTRNNRADSNESEAESCVNEIASVVQSMQTNGHFAVAELKQDAKMCGFADPGFLGAAPPRHGRSLSMDSFMSRMDLGTRAPVLQNLQQTGYDPQNGPSHVFSLEFGNGEFTSAEMEKIVSSEKLAEIALSDPKRVKRILANRLSAARSKERKMRYISELEHKVRNLQCETNTLSAQVNLLQRDSTGLTSQNNELKFRLQAMEQQAQLKDALNEALNAEVQRLKFAAAQLGDAHSSNGTTEQLTRNTKLQQQQLQSKQSAPISAAEEQ